MNELSQIKRLVLRGNVLFTAKAENEMLVDDLDRTMVTEAILNARGITKRLRSVNPRTGKREMLYVIVSMTFDGVKIYTKGKKATVENREVFYVLISTKKSTT